MTYPLIIGPGSPWPERVGLRCRDVTGELDPRIYPRHGLGRTERIVLIENDPHAHKHHYENWTCVLDREHLTSVAS